MDYDRWVKKHLDELVRQHPGKVIAVYRGKLVAVGELTKKFSPRRGRRHHRTAFAMEIPRPEDFEAIL